jgi:hypothetical protein
VWSAGGELVEEFGDAGVVNVAHGKSGGLVVESGEEKSYIIMIIHQLSIYTSMKHFLLYLKLLALVLNSLDTLSDIRLKAFKLLF